MLHQLSSIPAFFAGRRADGDVGNRTGVILKDVEDRANVILRDVVCES